MIAFLLLALLLGANSPGGLRHLRPAKKSAVPVSAFRDICADLVNESCRQEFLASGAAWLGDVNDDGRNELLVFPGSSFSGAGGQSYFLYQRQRGKWVSLAEDGWQLRGRRFDILPVVRQGYHDLRIGVDLCVKWNGTQYEVYDASDYRQLSPDLFLAPDVYDAALLWQIRYAGLTTVQFEPVWISDVPRGSANAELDDPLVGLRWVAMFKGGVYGVRGERSFLLLPQFTYLGAAKLRFEGDWLLIYDEQTPPRVLARYHRRTHELQIERPEE